MNKWLKISSLLAMSTALSISAWVDNVTVTNNYGSEIEVAVVQAKRGDDGAELLRDKQPLQYVTIRNRAEAQVKRPSLETGIDRYVVVRVLNPGGGFVLSRGGSLESLYGPNVNVRFSTLQNIKNIYSGIFAFTPAGNLQGKQYYVKKAASGQPVVSNKP